MASDEDYACAEKAAVDPSPPPVAVVLSQGEQDSTDGNLRRSLASSQATINRLQSEIRLLQDTVRIACGLN